MAEYLAPGVYVEETSFRARSIEGVSTSTTAFVGPSRRGPVGGTPELITSLGDFERIYGSLNDLSFGTNYLAHAVRAYFNEGGSRLYVSRTYSATPGFDGRAASPLVAVGADPANIDDQARFVARFPGAAGNGHVTLRLVGAPATVRTMDTAIEGSLLRVGGDSPATGARLQGGFPPFAVPNGGVLRLIIGGADTDITLSGAAAEAFATTALPDPVDLTDTNTTLQVTIDGISQTINLPTNSQARTDFVAALNRQIRGGYVRLSDAGDAGDPNRLVFGSDRRGTQASVTVAENAELGFAAPTTALGSANPANNVGDLGAVTADEINALLVAAGAGARASLGTNGRLEISTTASGAAATLAAADAGANSVHAALGLSPLGAGESPAAGTAGATVSYYLKSGSTWRDANGADLSLAGLGPADAPPGGAELLTLNIVAEDADRLSMVYNDLGFDPRHTRAIGAVLASAPTRRIDALENLFAIEIGSGVTPFELRAGLFPTGDERILSLTGGSDGLQPIQGATTLPGTYESALTDLEQLEDISIVATPGASAFPDAQGIQSALLSHVDNPRRGKYRIAVLDTAPAQAISDARTARGRIDSTHAALYYPWVVISNPLARPGVESIPREILLPPSGFVCGVYARNDVERGVHKAPANEVIRSALRFEFDINFAQQEVLNPIGVNCLRYLPGRGYRVWGARTASSDPEWKYVNVRRYFNYLERSIDQGTQWAVFESNGERLWANVRDTVSAFLYNEWVSGALLGGSPREAFFVRCDRSTMTQNDLDNGRLICLIGVAALKPAEFVIFRIGQKTADARS